MSAKEGRASHSFGGDWTQTKLQILSKYLKAYNVALDGKPFPGAPFRRAFIDAFAGTGYRSVASDAQDDPFRPTIPELDVADTVRLLDGSARMALNVEPRFDMYIFIERNKARCDELRRLRDEYSDRAESILICPGEANEEILNLCRKNWTHHRAVMFLDPYGIRPSFETQQIAPCTCFVLQWLIQTG